MTDGIPRPIQCLVFDFAGTLCAEQYFTLLRPEHERAIRTLVLGENSSQWADPWRLGQVPSAEVAEYLASPWLLPAAEILEGLGQGGSSLPVNAAVWTLARDQQRRNRKPALGTGTREVFRAVVVPAHPVDQLFAVRVNSSGYGAGRKEVLWPMAFEHWGPPYGYSTRLLSEERLRKVDRFSALGGLGPH